MLSGKIFITGGTGFLGRGIIRHAQRAGWDAEFTVYSRDEWKQAQLKKRYADRVRCVLGDICDNNRLALAMQGHDTVIHTAALKFIPEGERDASEFVRVNIDGSRSVIDAAHVAGVKTAVLISTDKAPQPINTYGMTKAIMERFVHETFGLEQAFGTKYVACRYGNVIGSTGSIWPVWKEAQASHGLLHVTDPEMTRYFMSIDDAVRLIVASTRALGGTVVLPEPSAAVIGDVAKACAAELHLDLNVVGPRPGEKKHEQMISGAEVARVANFHDNYFMLLPPVTTSKWQNKDERVGKLLSSEEPVHTITGEQFVQTARDSEDI